jgi:bifunctional non-homologous end joining protein LigD
MSRRWGPRRKSPDAAERGFIEPCLATLKPQPPTEGTWVHELKLDGYRMMARQGGDGPMLFTRMGFDWTERFGERIADAIDALRSTAAYLDGEVVVENADGVPDFAALQDELQRGRSDRFVYYAFDLLQLNGKDLRQRPLIERKEALRALLARQPKNGSLRYSAHYEGDPHKLLEETCGLGLEGIISKRADRPYRSGRGLDWIKSRCMQQDVFTIAGYEPTKASPRQIGALLLGRRAGRAFHYMGHVGTGFSRAAASELWQLLNPRRRKENPFDNIAAKDLAGAVFVEPELSAEVDYRGWTGEGRVRHASFRGLVPSPARAPARPRRAATTRRTGT